MKIRQSKVSKLLCFCQLYFALSISFGGIPNTFISPAMSEIDTRIIHNLARIVSADQMQVSLNAEYKSASQGLSEFKEGCMVLIKEYKKLRKLVAKHDYAVFQDTGIVPPSFLNPTYDNLSKGGD